MRLLPKAWLLKENFKLSHMSSVSGHESNGVMFNVNYYL